jgi:hypothetical protein
MDSIELKKEKRTLITSYLLITQVHFAALLLAGCGSDLATGIRVNSYEKSI